MRRRLDNDKHRFYFTHHQYKCDAYKIIEPLSIIHSKEEMIQFVIDSEFRFDSPEEYEEYFGFERRWNEDTGKILETTREYYLRGGKFTNIPDRYPCVIYFSYVDSSNKNYDETDFQWVYIGK